MNLQSISTNILDSSYQSSMRQALHESLIKFPRTMIDLQFEIGIFSVTLKKFLFHGMDLKTKQAYLMIGFLKKQSKNEL